MHAHKAARSSEPCKVAVHRAEALKRLCEKAMQMGVVAMHMHMRRQITMENIEDFTAH